MKEILKNIFNNRKLSFNEFYRLLIKILNRMTVYEPIQLKFVIDSETETKCNFGEYYDHDGTILINLLHMDDQDTIISTIKHEVLHKLIVEESGERTTTEQDHFIIPRLLS